MRAAPARHRVTRGGEPRDAHQGWPASDLLTSAGAGKPGRHARKDAGIRSPGNYALHVGRVGALAVSLGVGFAIASAAQPAYADTGTTSGGESSAASNDSTDRPGVNRKRGPRTATKPSVTEKADETVEEPELAEPGTPEPVQDPAEAVAEEPTDTTEGRKDRPRIQIDKPLEVQKAVTVVLQAAPEPPAESVAPVVKRSA